LRRDCNRRADALLIDATIVRLMVIPAVMSLLGGRNWYLPAWFEWLPHVEIEDPSLVGRGPMRRAESGAVTASPRS
jgi:uncharacterized membrane protein YdfJ with MMPL/SSD domain